MKHFTTREKRIISRIIDDAVFDTYVLTNAFNDLLFGQGVAFDSSKGLLQFEKSKYNNVSSILQVEREFIETALLIHYLEEHQYIYIIKDSQEPPLQCIGDTIANPIGKHIPADIAEIFINSCARIVVLNRLLDLRDNDFRTYEELQLIWARRQTIFAACTLIVAILTFGATLLIPSCSSNNCNRRMEHGNIEATLTADVDVEVINSQLEKTNAYLLQIIEHNNLTNNFKISPKVQIKTPKKSIKQNKCSGLMPVLKIDTINCNGETYLVLPYPPQK